MECLPVFVKQTNVQKNRNKKKKKEEKRKKKREEKKREEDVFVQFFPFWEMPTFIAHNDDLATQH